MRLLHLTLPVSDVATVAAYFHDVLQQRVVSNHVHIGWSTIELQPAGDHPVGGALGLQRTGQPLRRGDGLVARTYPAAT